MVGWMARFRILACICCVSMRWYRFPPTYVHVSVHVVSIGGEKMYISSILLVCSRCYIREVYFTSNEHAWVLLAPNSA